MYFGFQVCKDFPYLTCEHFPADWAITEMVKLYLCGQVHQEMYMSLGYLETDQIR